jgi:hypothetical protein
VCVAETISVRFDERTRQLLEEEATRQGVGVSTFVRQLAEAELKRVRRSSIRAEADALSAYLAAHPTAFDDDDPDDWFSPPREPKQDRTVA